jgi:hypothetical protein
MKVTQRPGCYTASGSTSRSIVRAFS